MNVDAAIKRGSTSECVLCHKKGATISCFKPKCTNVYHLSCAQRETVVFFQDKTLLCPLHAPKPPIENELLSLKVNRRVYINRDEVKQIASIVHHEEKKFSVRVGSLIFHSIGQLLQHQISSGKFNTRDHIYPVGFKTSRYYWSCRTMKKRCRYVMSITEEDAAPMFTVRCIEPGLDDVVYKDATCNNVWTNVFGPLDKMRRENDLVKMFPSYLSGEDMFGLTEPSLLRIIESMPGMDGLKTYAFKFGRCQLVEMPLAINPTGCARSEPKLRTHFKR